MEIVWSQVVAFDLPNPFSLNPLAMVEETSQPISVQDIGNKLFCDYDANRVSDLLIEDFDP